MLPKTPSLSLRALRTSYVDVVANDVIHPIAQTRKQPADRVFGLPLAVDTLVLFYNDLLNESGFPESAKTWSEFLQISKLTRLGDNNSIIQSVRRWIIKMLNDQLTFVAHDAKRNANGAMIEVSRHSHAHQRKKYDPWLNAADSIQISQINQTGVYME